MILQWRVANFFNLYSLFFSIVFVIIWKSFNSTFENFLKCTLITKVRIRSKFKPNVFAVLKFESVVLKFENDRGFTIRDI